MARKSSQPSTSSPRRTKSPARVSRVRVTSFTPSRFPADGNLAELYAELLAYPNVHGCYIGHKTRRPTKNGKKQDVPNKKLAVGPLAIICCVDNKPHVRHLDRCDRIPRTLKWPRTRSKHFNIPSDVQYAERGRTYVAPVVGPGDDLHASPAAHSGRATLGIALKHPIFGRVVTTAGHTFIPAGPGNLVFGAAAPVLTISNAGLGATPGTFQALPLKAIRSPQADYALLQPQAESRNLFRDTLNISGVHFARPEDVGTTLFALTRTDIKQTVLRGVAGTLAFDGVQMTGLLFVDDVTEAGDSGCCLVDSSFRVWGLLVGDALINNVNRSVFASANFVLALENAQLA
jgi:hypothetical protein